MATQALATPAAILYDFDYTLADSSPGIIECVQYAFQCLRLEIPPAEAICRTIGRSLPETFCVLANGAAAASPPEELESEFIRLFVGRADEIMVQRTRLLPGVKTTLATLRRRGLRQGVVTTKFRRRIESVLARERCRETMDVIVGGDDVVEPKPAPEGILRALASLHLAPADCLYVGDSPVDAAAAQAAGMAFAAVATGVTPEVELRSWQPRALLRGLAELPPLLAE